MQTLEIMCGRRNATIHLEAVTQFLCAEEMNSAKPAVTRPTVWINCAELGSG